MRQPDVNLEDPKIVSKIAKQLGCDCVPRMVQTLQLIRGTIDSESLFALLLNLLAKVLPETSEPERVLDDLHRFLRASNSPQSLLAQFERDSGALSSLVTIFSVSEYLTEQLVREPELFDWLRLSEGRPVARDILVDQIRAEIEAASDESQVKRILRIHKHRETMRIAYGDFVGQLPLEIVSEQNSSLAEAVLEGALQASWREAVAKHGEPIRDDSQLARMAIIALGKLGGAELNYSSDIDLIFVADTNGFTNHPRGIENREFFSRVARSISGLLSEPTERGIAYRVDLRMRPHGSQGATVVSPTEALHYYDTLGRTWERQAFVKARAVAGSFELGNSLLERLQSWIYRRYLTRADITGIAALKRRIEKRSREAGEDSRNVKTGFGGIRDVEFVIQFLQLLNGGELQAIRSPNTLVAIAELEQNGCLTAQERSHLEVNYRFLRRIEHTLQIGFDLQTHTLPEEPIQLQRFAIQAGYRDQADETAAAQFAKELAERADKNRRILDHLLHDAFGEDLELTEESDLVLDPEPSTETIERVLSKYSFKDPHRANRLLLELSRESISFISTRRCRHFLAAIAPRLLTAIASTPDPDSTLQSLATVSESLGGKAVLWELLSLNAPSMELYIRLCASSPYLSGILIGNPGMIDELMDSLMIDRLPSVDELEENLFKLCDSAEDTDPILHSFKNSMHLRVGVRDILGKERIDDTHRSLSDIAEVCLRQTIVQEYHRLVQKLGEPIAAEGSRAGEKAELIVLAVGKLGGREPNYHSDLDVLFLFDSDGSTRSLLPSRRFQSTTNRNFFNQLSQRVIQVVNRVGPGGRLYDLDACNRPLGSSGPLAITIDEMQKYFLDHRGQLWERQALCKARPICGSLAGRRAAMLAVQTSLTQMDWQPELSEQIRQTRYRYEEDASPANLKRSIGGTVDVEFVVQMLQLRYARKHPEVLVPNTLEAIEQLVSLGKLRKKQGARLSENYRFLRSIESGLRLMNLTARHDLPEAPEQLKQLAFLLGYKADEPIDTRCQQVRVEIREMFESIFDEAVDSEPMRASEQHV